MTAVEAFLWPLVGFLAVAAIFTALQARRMPATRPRAIILAALAAALLLYLLSTAGGAAR